MNFQPDNLNIQRALEQTDARLGQHLRTLTEAQRFLQEAMAGKSFLLVDTTFNRGVGKLRRTAEQMRSYGDGWATLVQLYIDKLFSGRLPRSTTDIFQAFLGPGIDIVRSDIHSPITPDARFAAVGFTGSAANVSYGLDSLLRNQSIEGADGVTHGEILEFANTSYRLAVDHNLLVKGMCFGHQMIATERGGMVERGALTTGLGMVPVEGTNYGTSVLLGATNLERPLSGRVAGYHDELVTQAGPQSAVIMHATDQAPGRIYGMVHVADGRFTGDSEQDADIIKGSLSAGRHVAITTQWHGEFEGVMPLLEFSATKDPAVFEEDYAPDMAALAVELLAGFIAQHGSSQHS